MDRLFLDANVLFSAAYKPDARVRQLWKLEDVVLCSSRYALEEARVNLPEEVQTEGLSELSEKLQLYDSHDRPMPSQITLAEKDEPILLSAIEARADYLLTGDFRHFGRYFGRRIEGILIAPPGRYLKIKGKR
jgi:uncharacterized protein